MAHGSRTSTRSWDARSEIETTHITAHQPRTSETKRDFCFVRLTLLLFSFLFVSCSTQVDFPIIADPDRKISCLYGMLDQNHLEDSGLPYTVRSVFIIGPGQQSK